MAYGLPVEGDDGPFAGEAVTEMPTCEVTGTVADGVEAMELASSDIAIVVACDGLAIGVVDRDGLSAVDPGTPLLDVMDVVPGTVRPSVLLESVSGRAMVTTSDGRLLGEVVQGEHQHLGDRMETELDDTLAAVHERFGDRQPSEEELQAFLRERLVDEGRTPEEADEFLAALGDDT